MDKKFIIAIVVVVIAVVAIPVSVKLMPKPSSPGAVDKAPAGTSAPAAVQPPALNADNLANTKWILSIQKIPVTVSFLPGGKATAQAPILKAVAGSDTIEGTWSVNGAELTLNATVKGETQSVKFQISGDQILVDGKPAQRAP